MMKNIQRALSITVCALSLSLSNFAHAHYPFFVPSSTTLAGKNPVVTIDAAASDNLFYYDHQPLRLDGLQITGPDGTVVAPENLFNGRLRNSFDLRLTTPGTYRVALTNEFFSANFKVDGKPQRWRGEQSKLASEIPANAEDLQVIQRNSRVETFVTSGKPNLTALTPKGSGLELQAITHPNDLMNGEVNRFRFLLDGKPAKQLKVVVIQGNTRYRNKVEEQTIETNDQGEFNVTFPHPGLYRLQAEVKESNNLKAPLQARVSSYAATLEVLPQ